MAVAPQFIPESLLEWHRHLRQKVIVKFEGPNGTVIFEGKLSKIAPTGAFIMLSGVETEQGRQKLHLPLERCKIMDPRKFNR
jgi:hypothetical protein